MSASDFGPSWQDCADAAAYIWGAYGYRVAIRLVQSVRRLDGKGNSSWTVVVDLAPREGAPGGPLKASESWGQGGSCKTAPQAIHRALMTACEILDARKREAAKQHAF